ncbi:flavin reductase family protein [Candidatus Woesearchaeota archaeon]|nr:flavin reductase family protein [Candidatus Woesearchaeota archaeon]
MTLIYNPRQVVLVSCRGNVQIMNRMMERDEVLPLSWHSPSASHPPMYSIFVQKNLGGAEMIKESGVFVVNFVPFRVVEHARKAMSVSGEYVDKLEAIGLHELPCEKLVDCFRLKEALGWLECEVVEHKEVGDHVLFLGKVVHSFMGVDDKRPFHVDGDEFATTK